MVKSAGDPENAFFAFMPPVGNTDAAALIFAGFADLPIPSEK
jgi:hypothetical protein